MRLKDVTPLRPKSNARIRYGYTLLEVTLSLAISVLLLGALYTAFNMLVQQTQSGRRHVSDANVVRAVLSKITNDISAQLAPLDPRGCELPESFLAAQSAQYLDDTGGTTSATEGSSTVEGEGVYAQFNLGVVGTADTLMLYVGQTPDPVRQAKSAVEAEMPPLNLRRVSYWMVPGAQDPLGLARREDRVATSTETLALAPFEEDEQELFVISRRVVAVQFEYFDGLTWYDEWNGADVASDGKTPYGPPAAIAVTLQIVSGEPDAGGQYKTNTFRHVVAIPCANGYVEESLLPVEDLGLEP